MPLLNRRDRGLRSKLYLEGAFSFAHTTIFQGVFLIGFAIMLGATTFQIGILLAIPFIANILQLFSAFILEATGTKKYTALTSRVFGRILLVIVILIAFGIIKDQKITILIAVLFLSNIFSAVGNLSLLSWFKDLIATNRLARFLGKRNMYASIGGMVVYIIGSFLVDSFDNIYGYLFIAAVVFGVVGAALLYGLPDRKRKIRAIKPRKLFSRLVIPFKDLEFRNLLRFGVLWSFALYTAGSFFVVFMLDDLKLRFVMVALFLVIDTLARVYGLNLWRKLADNFGAKPTLIIGATVTCFTPLALVFINKGNFFFIPLIFILSAVSYAAVDISLTQIMFKLAPRQYDAYYFSAFSSLTNISSAMGIIMGGAISSYLKSTALVEIISPLKWVFLVSFVLRVTALPLLLRIHEKKTSDVRDVLERLKTLRFASFFATVYNVTYYTSQIVLVPQKQLFLLQRRAARRMKNNIPRIMGILKKTKKALSKVSLPYTKYRLKKLEKSLDDGADNMGYELRTVFGSIVKGSILRLRKVEKDIDEESGRVVKQDAKKAKEAISNYEERLEKLMKKEFK